MPQPRGSRSKPADRIRHHAELEGLRQPVSRSIPGQAGWSCSSTSGSRCPRMVSQASPAQGSDRRARPDPGHLHPRQLALKVSLTVGSGPARFQTEPPACHRASWQLPGPDFHRQATTSLRTRRNTVPYVTVSPPVLLGARENLIALYGCGAQESGRSRPRPGRCAPALSSGRVKDLASPSNRLKHRASPKIYPQRASSEP